MRLSVPVARLADALPLMADVVMRPTFPAAELERLRKERLTRLLQARDDPAAIMEIAFPRLVFGEKHRYGTPAGGGTAEVKAITLDDLRAFHRTYYRPENSTLLVVGDVTAATVMPLLERAFGSWKATGAGDHGRDGARGAAAHEAADLSHRQTGRRAVADPHRLGRRAAIDAGLSDASRCSTPSSADRSRRG